MKNQKNFRRKQNATNASYSITYPALGCHIWDIRPEKCDKVTLALKKSGFRQELAGEKFPAAEKFGPGQLRLCSCRYAISKPILRIRLERSVIFKKRSGQCQICSEKIQKVSLFLTKTGQKNGQKISQHAAQLWCSIG